MTDVSPGLVKGLFAQLVKTIGGNEAAGAFLGVCHQRVSQLKRIDCPDMPTIMQVVCLEAACGRAIVTDALAEMVGGVKAQRDLQRETRDVIYAAAHLDQLASSAAPERQIDEAVARLNREVSDVTALRAANGN